MAYEAKDYAGLLGMEGFSDGLLNTHFTLYKGYVANTNKLFDNLSGMLRDGKAATPEYAELKRRLGGKAALNQDGKLGKLLSASFGSYDAWLQDLKGTATMRGIGWAILYQDVTGGRLFNQWINEHDAGHPAGCQPLLVLDVFEHAFITDYGLKRADYIEAFLKNIDWKAVEARIR